MRKEFLILGLTVFSLKTGIAEAACTLVPNCTEMGYTRTASECTKGSVKCPWNTSLVYCKDNSPTCQIGWVYFEDGTCSAENSGQKKALGVVVYITDGGKHGQVMATKSLGSFKWSTVNEDIASLPNFDTSETASKDFDSCGNTSKIMAKGKAYPAAIAAANYALTTGGGRWCLPAAGIMTSIFNHQAEINEGFSRINGINGEKISCCMWTSSERGITNGAWYSAFGRPNGVEYGGKANYNYVYPVMEF